MSEELAQGAGGGLNAAKTEALDLLDTFRLARLENRLPTPQVTAVVADESGNSVVKGTGFSPVQFTAERTKTVYFCGCKNSGRKPLCDGTHSRL